MLFLARVIVPAQVAGQTVISSFKIYFGVIAWTCKLLGKAELFQFHFFFMLLLQVLAFRNLRCGEKNKKKESSIKLVAPKVVSIALALLLISRWNETDVRGNEHSSQSKRCDLVKRNSLSPTRFQDSPCTTASWRDINTLPFTPGWSFLDFISPLPFSLFLSSPPYSSHPLHRYIYTYVNTHTHKHTQQNMAWIKKKHDLQVDIVWNVKC